MHDEVQNAGRVCSLLDHNQIGQYATFTGARHLFKPAPGHTSQVFYK